MGSDGTKYRAVIFIYAYIKQDTMPARVLHTPNVVIRYWKIPTPNYYNYLNNIEQRKIILFFNNHKTS